MLKFFFALLLLANLLLFAVHQGYLDPLLPNGREPARMGRQINADKIRLQRAAPRAAAPEAAPAAPASSTAAAPSTAPAPSTATAATVPPAVALALAQPNQDQALAACAEIGNFSAAQAARFEAQLAALPLGARPARRWIRESISHMVLIPPRDGKEGAEQRVEELRKLGIHEFFVLQDDSRRRWGISLGLFKTEEAADSHLAEVTRLGVRDARVIKYGVDLNRVAFRLHGLDDNARAGIRKIMPGFGRVEMRSCE